MAKKAPNDDTNIPGTAPAKTGRTRNRRSSSKDVVNSVDTNALDATPATSASETYASVEYPRHEVADDRPVQALAEPSEEEIRFRAYQRYIARGGQHGADFDDWLQAEQELRRR